MWLFKSKEIEDLEYRVKRIERKLKQVECHHSYISFKENLNAYIFNRITKHYEPIGIYDRYHSCCENCDKILNIYLTKQDFNSAKAAYLRKQADELEKTNEKS